MNMCTVMGYLNLRVVLNPQGGKSCTCPRLRTELLHNSSRCIQLLPTCSVIWCFKLHLKRNLDWCTMRLLIMSSSSFLSTQVSAVCSVWEMPGLQATCPSKWIQVLSRCVCACVCAHVLQLLLLHSSLSGTFTACNRGIILQFLSSILCCFPVSAGCAYKLGKFCVRFRCLFFFFFLSSIKDGACAPCCVTVLKIQWKPFLIATWLHAQSYWAGWHFRVSHNVFARCPFVGIIVLLLCICFMLGVASTCIFVVCGFFFFCCCCCCFVFAFSDWIRFVVAGICAMCGKQILDTKGYKQSAV